MNPINNNPIFVKKTASTSTSQTTNTPAQSGVKKIDDCGDDVLKVTEKIMWLHGTNSSILSFLPSTDYTLIPTGKLLDRGISPMCGEISCGGMRPNGVNQDRVSVWTIEKIEKGWEYAARISNTFNPAKLEGKTGRLEQSTKSERMEIFFLDRLCELEKMTPDSNQWDPILIKLYQLKQWAPETFTSLCSKYNERISNIQKTIQQNLFGKEMVVLKALEYDTKKLMKAIDDPKIREEVENDFPYLKEVTYPIWHKEDSASSFVGTDLNKLVLYDTEDDDGRWGYRFASEFKRNYLSVIIMKMFGQSFLNRIKSHVQNKPKKFLKKWWGAYQKFGGIDPKIEVLLKNAVGAKIEALMKKNALPYKKRMERFERLFNDSPFVKFDENDRDNLTNPYPMLIASTKQKSMSFHRTVGGGENHLKSSKLGRDINIIFVRDEHAQKLKGWLAKHKFSDQVRIFSCSEIKDIASTKLTHSPDQVEFRGRFIDKRRLHKANQMLNLHVFPIYNATYVDGSKRKWHGVMHSMRATLFSHVLASLYDDAGHKIKSSPANLLVATAMHDSAREDDGVDKWDNQSGEKCKKLLKEVVKDLKDEEADLFEHAIADKDNPNPTSLEQKIVHDADCIEILRCLYREEDFQMDRLWITKDLDPKTAGKLVAEAKGFIKLTKNPVIKEFVETSGNPLFCLHQVLRHACDHYDKFHLMVSSVNQATIQANSPDKYLLTSEIESLIKQQLKEISG